ncbi:MAG: MFS transporter [Bacteroidota bacterium]
MKNKESGKPDVFAAIRIGEFRMFMGFRFFMTVAVMMQSVIVGWQIYDITHDPFQLGMIGLTEAIPQIAIALFAGHLADRYDRKKIIILTSILFLIGSVLLSVYSFPEIGLAAQFGVMPIYVVIFITGLVRGLMHPANTALMAQLVPRELYPNSSSWNSGIWHTASVSGLAFGGLLCGFVGISFAYIISTSIVLVSILFTVSIKKKPLTVKNIEASVFQNISTGVKFVFKNKLILSAMSLDMFAVLFGGATSMLPVFASDILKVGPEGYGILRATPAVGAVIMSVIMAARPPMKNTGLKLFLSITAFGLCIIGFAFSTNFYLSLALLFASGVFDNVSVVIRHTIMQLYAPDEMRGRVASVNSIFIGSSNEIGAFESGLACSLLGLVPSVIFGGGMTVLVVIAIAAFSPSLRNLRFEREKHFT